MSDRQFPVRPNLEQLKHQAKDLLRAEPSLGKLAHAQHALARSYGLPSWSRLVLACRMTDAIWRDDVEAVRELVVRHPRLLHENARGVAQSNWGPPMSYAANLGRDRIIAMLRELGADDLNFAFDRACLQGRIDTARQLCAMGARPDGDSVAGPCETLCSPGLGFLLDLGCKLDLSHVALILQTYSRNPAGKHQCLELTATHGITLPDTPPMAVHRGRIDLLERHLEAINERFSHEDIYPPALGCDADHSKALHGTPLAGGGLLHLAVDNDEIEIAQWLLAHGVDVNLRAAIDADGFGGHTALFGCVVSQPYRVGRRSSMTGLLLEHGADPNVRASLRKRLRYVADETMQEYRDVTPLAWGEQFHDQEWVDRDAMRLIADSRGTP
jgi:ankyrin repeat protein